MGERLPGHSSRIRLGIFVWRGLPTWTLVVFFIAGNPVPSLNYLTLLTPCRRWLGHRGGHHETLCDAKKSRTAIVM